MSYDHDDLELLAEALMVLLACKLTPKKRKRANELADKVVADQSGKACA
jgi:hypothetical protein